MGKDNIRRRIEVKLEYVKKIKDSYDAIEFLVGVIGGLVWLTATFISVKLKLGSRVVEGLIKWGKLQTPEKPETISQVDFDGLITEFNHTLYLLADYAVAVLLLVTIPLIGYYIVKVFQKRRMRHAENKYAYIFESTEKLQEIQKGLYQYEARMKIRALADGVNSYQRVYYWTGSERNFKIQAFCDGQQIGVVKLFPNNELDKYYTFVFDEIKRGEEAEITVQIKLSDKQGVMDKKLSFRTSHPKGCQKLVLEVQLGQEWFFYKKREIKFNNKHLAGSPAELSKKFTKTAYWHVHENHKITDKEVYFISWTKEKIIST